MTTTNRIRQVGPIITSREDMSQLLKELAIAQSDQNAIERQRENEIAEINAKYEAPLANLEAKIKGQMAIAEQWATANPKEFGKARSIKFPYGKIGFRKGKHALKLLSNWTWETVLGKIQSVNARAWLRVSVETDKEAIISYFKEHAATGAEATTRNELATFGVQVVQEGSFFVDVSAEVTRNQDGIPTAFHLPEGQ